MARGKRGGSRGTENRGRPSRGTEDWDRARWDTGSWDADADDRWLGEEEPASGSLPAIPGGGLPPWEQPGWEGAGERESYGSGDRQGGRRARPRDDGGYDTGPAGRGGYGAAARRRADGFDASGYDAGTYDTGAYDAGGYDTGGFEAEHHEPGSYGAGAYDADSYDTGSFEVGGVGGYAAYPPAGDPRAGDDYPPQAPYPEGAAYDDYAGADDEDYTGYQEAYQDYGGDPRGDPGRGSGYRQPGDWYGDVDDNQDWADEEYEEEFLPGLKGAAASIRSESRGGDRGRPGAGPGKPKRKRGMRRAAAWIALSFLVIVLCGAGGGFYYVYRTYFHPPDYSGPGTGSVIVQIKPGQTATAIGGVLQRDGVVASARAFANAAKASPKGNSLEPGYYRLHKHMQASLALQMLLNPSSRFTYTVVIPEGFRLSEIIARLGAQTHDLSGYQQAIKNISALGLPSYAHGSPEGYLFPATYQVSPGTAPPTVLRQMVQRFDQEAASVNLPKWAAHDQMTQGQIIVVASLVQAEGGRLSDFPKIARVIYNRLNVGMQLQLDSTVMYALHTDGIAATQRQLNAASRSPYDTYTHYGLPPGPIDSPGDAAIKAALHPAAGNWLYFVTVDPKTGLTKFTSSFTQFSQWEAQFRATLAKGNG